MISKQSLNHFLQIADHVHFPPLCMIRTPGFSPEVKREEEFQQTRVGFSIRNHRQLFRMIN